MNLYKSNTYIQDLEIAAESTVGINQLCGKKIMITGATGTIGSFLVDLLLRYNETHDADITVYAAGRLLSRLENRFSNAHSKNLVYVEHDNSLPITFDHGVDYI